MSGTFTSADVTRHAGITSRQLHHWTAAGYLTPQQQQNKYGTGTGFGREWTRAQADVARAMGRLVTAGLVPRVAATVAQSRDTRTEIAPGVWIEVLP